MDIEIRPIAPDEFPLFIGAVETAFSGALSEGELEHERAVTEYDRDLAAFEDGKIVGTAAAVSYQVTVPGGAQVSAAGITAVGVLPTHRRRGINTALMDAQLQGASERGEPLAILYASEGGIYGRFGYGMASLLAEIEMDAQRSAYVRGYVPHGRARLLPRDEALPQMRPVYEAVQRERPGAVSLDDRWWDYIFYERKKDKDEPNFYTVHEDDEGRPDAYAVYRVKHEWPNGVPTNELKVQHLIPATPQGAADMWRYLFDVDLVAKVTAWDRPADEPLLWLLQEPRRMRLRLGDGLFVRLVDVAAALEARSYGVDGRIVFELRDAFRPGNEGRYELEVENGVGSCRRTDERPEFACSVNDLGAAYLGGTSFRSLARALQVRELVSGTLIRADAMFAWDPAPWSLMFF